MPSYPSSLYSRPDPIPALMSTAPTQSTILGQYGDEIEQIETALGVNAAASQTYTPTWSNLTVGNGTVTARYLSIGDLIIGSVKLVFGSTTAVTGTVGFTFPVTVGYQFTSSMHLQDASPFLNMLGAVHGEPSGNASLWFYNVPSGMVVAGNVTATTPITWTTSDVINASFTYQTT